MILIAFIVGLFAGVLLQKALAIEDAKKLKQVSMFSTVKNSGCLVGKLKAALLHKNPSP